MKSLHFYDAEDRPWPNPRLTTASILGHVTDTSIRIWVRARDEGHYHLVVSTRALAKLDVVPARLDGGVVVDAAGRAIGERAYPVDLRYAKDNTFVVDVTGLEPDTRYHYALVALFREEAKRWELGYEEDLSFRTDPTQRTELAFGLMSCHMPYLGEDLVNMSMLTSLDQELRDARARMLIAAGDQVYVDGNDKFDIWRWLRRVKDARPTREDMLSWYRDIYRGYWGMLPLRRVFRSLPTYMIWDDHEIMDGWGSFTDEELSNELDTIWEWENQGKNLALAREMFEAAKVVYREYQHSHNPETPEGQLDYAFDCLPAASFYVLDMRGHRNYGGEDGERILGKAQMERLEAWLASAAGEVLFVVSPVPVVHASSFVVNNLDLHLLGIADDLRDGWEHETNWTERNRLLTAVFSRSHATERPVVFLSGDVHIAGAFKLYHQAYPKARVHQLTSSGITFAALSELMRRGLKLIVSAHGALGDAPGTPEADRFRFKTLHTYHRNHFAIVRASEGNVSFDVFGANADDHAVTKLNRIHL